MKILKTLSYIVLFISFLSVFAFMVVHVHEGGQSLGFLATPIRSMTEFPRTTLNVLREVKKPERLTDAGPTYNPINELDYNLYALNGHFEDNKWNIRLFNLRNDSIVHQWFLDESHYTNPGRIFAHSPPLGPIVLEDLSLILHVKDSKNLYKLDKNSNVIWKNSDYFYHHAINLAADGNLWTCTGGPVSYRNRINKSINYVDNSITKVDIKTGKVIFNKSVTEILFENQLPYILHGMTNNLGYMKGDDPLHLNDVEPVMTDGTHWKKGDVFLSFRHRSLILLYRPSTNKVIRVIQGPFYNQHDVDIQSDSTISLFNNNFSSLTRNLPSTASNTEQKIQQNINSNAEVLIYNMNSSSFETYIPKQFETEKIFTMTQGLHEILSNGDLFVEEQNNGRIFLFNKEKILLKKYINEPINGLAERPYWIRIYENINFLNTK